MRRNNIEISKELRLQTLHALLSGKDLHVVAMVLGIKVKTLKARLSLIYKFYKVKTRLELMALYVNIPLEIRKVMRQNNTPIVRKKSYRTREQYGQETKDNEILPFGANNT
jgi:hypothetical protein